MHGIPPLGYDVKDRRLVVNHAEAAQVRMIFRRLIETESILAVVNDMRGLGYQSKAWTTRDGRLRTPQPHDRSTIQKILHNRTYLGELKHLDQYFKECHPAIVDAGLWDQVHAVLAKNSHARGNASRARVHFLLKGLLFGPDRRALTPWHTTKRSGRMYRYYLSTAQIHEGKAATQMPRLPAQEVESLVVSYLRTLLTSQDMLKLITQQAVALDRALDEARVTVAMRQFDQVWDALFPAEQQRLVKLLVEKIVVHPEAIEIRFHPNGIASLASDFERKAVAA